VTGHQRGASALREARIWFASIEDGRTRRVH
jgi:hypothetical protein